MQKKTKTAGRPRKPAASKRSENLTIRLKAAEKAAIERGAAEAQLTVTDYIVSLASAAAR